MAFVQVWLLCVAAFLLGSAVTWLLFVRPLRAPAAAAADPPTDPGIAVPVSSQADAAGPPPAPANDPALMTLGGDLAPRTSPGLGVRAGGALDLMGVARPGQVRESPTIPRQAGPSDDPPPAR